MPVQNIIINLKSKPYLLEAIRRFAVGLLLADSAKRPLFIMTECPYNHIKANTKEPFIRFNVHTIMWSCRCSPGSVPPLGPLLWIIAHLCFTTYTVICIYVIYF